MRLIDADVLKVRISEEKDMFEIGGDYSVGYNNGLEMAHSIVLAAPTIEAEPVKHGEWKKIADDYCGLSIIKCSLCHEEWCFECFDDAEQLNYHYCPNCGAKMDLEE